MILCHNCLHKNMVGAVFCSECGAQLVFSDGVPTSTIKTGQPTTQELSPVDALKPLSDQFSFDLPEDGEQINLALNLVSVGEVLHLSGQDEYTLGRVSEGQPIVPDIDLSVYKAYESGVSRMHASIRKYETMVSVTDLGSANGTRINGRQISAHIPYPLKNGDILTLGKFKIQILIKLRAD